MLNKLDNPLDRCDLKFASDGGSFTGYASVFGSVDSMGDTVLKGAFADTLKDRTRPVRMFFGHSPGRPLGIWTKLFEDEAGLLARGEFTPGNTDAQNIRASLKHGAVDGLSIGFRIPTGGAEDTEGGGRIISKIELVEISVVSLPAEDNARVDISSVKSEIETISTIREAEYFLRDVGLFTNPMAKEFLSQLKTIIQRDADVEDEQIKELREQFARVTELNDVIKNLVA
jgi:HK97 family phage prohead protease